MPTPKKGRRLGGSPAHQRLMLANLATGLFEHGALTTTEAKARQLRPFAERLITKAKRGDLHSRRQVLSVIRDKGVVHVLFTEIGPKFADRPGGYTRITKVGPRKGDNAPMAVIELVEEEYTPTVRSSRPTSTPTAATAPATDAAEVDETEDAAAAAPTSQAEEAEAAEAEQVEAQHAVAEQAPEGETVKAPADAEDSEADEVDSPDADARSDATEDDAQK